MTKLTLRTGLASISSRAIVRGVSVQQMQEMKEDV